MKKIRHIIEYIIVKSLFGIFYIMPMKLSSAICSKIARSFGPYLKVNKTAKDNIKQAFPEFDDKQIKETLNDMWDNLGRFVGEFPHMAKFKGDEFCKIVEIEGLENFKEAVDSGECIINFSGHFANWEVIPKTAYEIGVRDLHLIYRKANNPYVEKLILDVRKNYQAVAMPKGAKGARLMVKAIKEKKIIGMLMDQKQNEGIAVPFFGRDAMTAPAIASLAIKYDCLIMPFQVQRVKGAKFKIKIHKAYKFKNTGDKEKDVYNAMVKINHTLENWIKEKPAQWFWVHNRWPKK